jgi:hypothetical protein
MDPSSGYVLVITGFGRKEKSSLRKRSRDLLGSRKGVCVGE